jgi:perosamine synthetase
MSYRVDWPARGHGYTESEIAAVAELMRTKGVALTNGPNVKLFEGAFAGYLNAPNAFSTMSCAHSLDIAAMLLGVSEGDEVIIPSHTYCASAIAFARRGAVIKWADIDPNYLTMSPESVRHLISSKTKAIVLVHLYGLLSPHTEELVEIAKLNSIALVEDCAQALGAKSGQSHVGTYGDIGCYSFHAQKNLTTLGEGGMITVKSPDLAAKVPGLRLNGHASFASQPYYWLPAMTNVDQDIEDTWPIKSTMTEAQALIGRLVLLRLDELTAKRRERGIAFRKAMLDFPELHFQKIPEQEMHSHHLLPARFDAPGCTRNDLIILLSEEYGIKVIAQYYPLHRYDLFRKTGYGNADVPETDRFFDNMVSFPFSLEIEDADFEYMIDSVHSALIRLRKS